MTVAVLIGMGLLLVSNLTSRYAKETPTTYLLNGDIRGMAIEHHGQLYTLNFEQQMSAAAHINYSVPVSKTAYNESTKPTEFTRLIIYRFDKPDAIMIPVALKNQDYVFSAPELYEKSYLLDLSAGQFKKLLESTYDP